MQAVTVLLMVLSPPHRPVSLQVSPHVQDLKHVHAELAQAYVRFKVAGTPEEAVSAREAVLAARGMLYNSQQPVQLSSETCSSADKKAKAGPHEVTNHASQTCTLYMQCAMHCACENKLRLPVGLSFFGLAMLLTTETCMTENPTGTRTFRQQ